MLLRRLSLFLSVLLVSASPSLHKRDFGVSSDASAANGQTFDYIIVGAGLAGITVAGRLSEDPSKTVLLIEAGNDERTNPLITNITNPTFGPDMMWTWNTESDRILRGGKTLGGTSSINGAVWTRSMKDQYDTLSQLLSEEDAEMNWNFDSLFFYMKKSETFHPPDEAQRAKGADFVPGDHGFTGPVQSAFIQGMYGGPQQPTFVDVVQEVTGIKYCPDIVGGDANCVSYNAHTINPNANGNRSSSAEAYLTPVEHERTNWLTLVGHRVTQVILDGEAPNVTATGVQFKNTDGTGDTFTANARLEVIVSSGTIGTPQVLQVSGIGDPLVLETLGIPVKVSLPTVGRNLQTRVAATLVHSLDPTFDPEGPGPENVLAYPSIKELFAQGAGSNGSFGVDEVSKYILDMYPTWAQSQAINALNVDALTTLFGIQANILVDTDAPIVEMVFRTHYPNSIDIREWLQAPFNRGNVTVTSPNIFDAPKVTVNWLDVDVDLIIQTAALRASRRVLNSPSFNGIVTDEITPGTSLVPDDGNGGSDETWQEWIWDNYETVNHPVGTAAMMRRDLGGVIDGKLRVYDTTNLRVVDASIFPLEITGCHPSSSLYGVAEKAAEIIKAGL